VNSRVFPGFRCWGWGFLIKLADLCYVCCSMGVVITNKWSLS